mmetsp:Transcript_11118/g.1676  ORF Transcript_11118/g.1676 Transcript_11118/m.1676 type:complete len:105 (+) Transcript_11118:481-795(+)
MAKGLKYGWTDLYIRDSFKMEASKDKEFSTDLMEVNTKENFRLIIYTELANILEKTETSTMDNDKTAKCMEKEYINETMVKHSKVNSKTIKSTERENLNIPMDD